MRILCEDSDRNTIRSYKLISFGLVFSTVNGIARYFAYVLFHNALIGSYVTLVVWCFLLGIFLIENWRPHGNRIVLGMIVYMLFIFFMYIVFSLSREWIIHYMNDLAIYLFVGIPMLFLMSAIKNWNYLLYTSGSIFRITAILTVLTYVISKGSFFTPMEWGNRVVPIALCYIVFAFYRKEKKDYPILVMLLSVSLLGGRQSFAIIIIALLITLFCKKSSTVAIFIMKNLVTVILGSCVVFLKQIILFISSILNGLGIYARSLDKLSSGFFEDSGRTLIYKACRKIILENGIKMNGIFSDHYYITNMHLGKNYTFAHNFIYEILIDFGIFVGGLLLVWLLFILIRRTIECKAEYRCLMFVFLLYGMGRIMVSSSIFIYFNFVVMMGFLFNDTIYNHIFRRIVLKRR